MISKPTFVINKEICKNNIQKMVDKCAKNHLIFRPHFKTHQSNIIGSFFMNAGVTKITVSSVSMAEYFANNGWNDITVAFPVNILELTTINKLAAKIQLNLVFESLESAAYISSNIKNTVGAFLKIDTGYGRTGILHNNFDHIEALINKISRAKNIQLLGFIAHAGHTYQVIGKNEVLGIHKETLAAMSQLKAHFHKSNPHLIYSIGDTPSCSLAENFEGIDEIRPGNFVYLDAMQLQIKSCQLTEIAALVACPVVAKHAHRNEIVIYAGAVHLSKEYLNSNTYGPHYGLIAEKENRWPKNLVPNVFVKKVSQEHGIIHCSDSFFETTNIGDLVYVVPIHSCLTANLLKQDTLII